MHLQAPASFIIVPYDSPIFSMDRLIGAKDLLYAHDQTGILHYERHMHYIQNAPAGKLDEIQPFSVGPQME